MLRSSSKTKIFGVILLAISSVVSSPAFATQDTENTNFRVNVNEFLAVSLTTPDAWARGDINQFLRNHIVLSVSSNNPAGYTATMSSKTTNTNLLNTRDSSYTIPTLTSTAYVGSFPVNKWGYTLYDEVAAPDDDSEYSGVPSVNHPETILYADTAVALQQDVFFGAKADISQASGTYANTVVFNVVTGVINDPDDPNYDPNQPDNPITPTNPSTPSTPNTPTYNPNTNTTTYTTVVPDTNDDTTTTTTEVTPGDTRSQYADPHGVVNKTTTTTDNGNGLAIGLASTAAVAGATGLVLFLIGKKRKDDEEEETGGDQQPPVQY